MSSSFDPASAPDDFADLIKSCGGIAPHGDRLPGELPKRFAAIMVRQSVAMVLVESSTNPAAAHDAFDAADLVTDFIAGEVGLRYVLAGGGRAGVISVLWKYGLPTLMAGALFVCLAGDDPDDL